MTAPVLPESKIDVLIVGAGPAGLFCANGLARAGISVRIIDKSPNKVIAGQADGLQPRTLEVLESYGLAERVLREGTQIHTTVGILPSWKKWRHRTSKQDSERCRLLCAISFRGARVTMHQADIQSVFLDSMASIGLKVDRPVIPVSIEISRNEVELKDPLRYPVKVSLKHLHDEALAEIVHAKFVVGADGAHSWVRKSLGISMEGKQTDTVWGVLDIKPETDFPDIRRKCIIHSLNGTCGVVPRENDMLRLYVQLPNHVIASKEDSRLDISRITPEEILHTTQKMLQPYKMDAQTFHWWTAVRSEPNTDRASTRAANDVVVGRRIAAKYSVHERVFIVGDAGHTHSPNAGQGMNASMNDSHNIIWKMVYVLRGWADMSLLNTYEDERRKYAQDLIKFDRMYSAYVAKKPKPDDHTGSVTQHSLLHGLQTFGDFTSGIGIHYSPSAIVNPTCQSVASGLTIGKRMPPHVFACAADGRPCEIHDLLPADARFKLLIFAGDTMQEAQMQRVCAFADALFHRDAFFRRYGGRDPSSLFDVLLISSASIHTTDHVKLGKTFGLHWSRVFVDDRTMYGHAGGDGYEAYGIDRAAGAAVVARPDGYVGMASPLKSAAELTAYFSNFLLDNLTHARL
ncbi:hypothetical protein NM688_g31 [Phlebia brevispora]|uniref:Uncharacterized protein n=1 Tax=Phlebia brevispora TaxID=194682 RepID=A0ACC1TFJ4_9APHY|nr:hypothetical protein NM688_g31 [Phlebia brevispora]